MISKCGRKETSRWDEWKTERGMENGIWDEKVSGKWDPYLSFEDPNLKQSRVTDREREPNAK